jgi:hypothetical protein
MLKTDLTTTFHRIGLKLQQMIPLSMLSHLLPPVVEMLDAVPQSADATYSSPCHYQSIHAYHPIDTMTAKEVTWLSSKYCWILQKKSVADLKKAVVEQTHDSEKVCTSASIDRNEQEVKTQTVIDQDKLWTLLTCKQDIALYLLTYFPLKSHFHLACVSKSWLRFYLIGMNRPILFPTMSTTTASLETSQRLMIPYLQEIGDLGLYETHQGRRSTLRYLHTNSYQRWFYRLPCLSGCQFCHCQRNQWHTFYQQHSKYREVQQQNYWAEREIRNHQCICIQCLFQYRRRPNAQCWFDQGIVRSYAPAAYDNDDYDEAGEYDPYADWEEYSNYDDDDDGNDCDGSEGKEAEQADAETDRFDKLAHEKGTQGHDQDEDNDVQDNSDDRESRIELADMVPAKSDDKQMEKKTEKIDVPLSKEFLPMHWHRLLRFRNQDQDQDYETFTSSKFFHERIKSSFISLFIWKSLCLSKANWLPFVHGVTENDDASDWLASLCPELFARSVWSEEMSLSRFNEIRRDLEETVVQPLFAYQYLLSGCKVSDKVNYLQNASKKLLAVCQYHDTWRERWMILRTSKTFKKDYRVVSDRSSWEESTDDSPYVTSYF